MPTANRPPDTYETRRRPAYDRAAFKRTAAAIIADEVTS